MDFPRWYFFSEALICLCGAAVLYSIYLRGDPGGQRDPTWSWLGNAVLVWSAIGFIGWIYSRSSWFVVTRIIFSTLNSAFLLLSIGYFDYGDYGFTGVIGARLKRFEEKPAWRKSVILLSLLVAVVVIAFSLAAEASPPVQSLPDILLSVLTLIILGVALYESFKGRGFWMLKYLSILIILLTILSQLPEMGLIVSEFRWPLLLVTKSMLILLFLALATSSVTQKGEFPLEGLELTGRVVDEKFLIVRLWIKGDSKAREMRVRDTYYNVLLELARSRKANPDGYFNLQKAGYYPEYLKRLAHSLRIERPQLLDNNRSGGYRLRIEPDKVAIIPAAPTQA
jgi:hypothetical protein